MKPGCNTRPAAVTVRRPLPWWEVLWKYSPFEAADSSWSLIVVSTYFGTLVETVFKRPGAEFGWAVTAASLAVAFASPLLGALADASGRRQPYLRICVAGVAIFTAALSFVHTIAAAIACFMLAYISANAAYTYFTAMLPAVSDKRNVSTIVSMTVGLGYVGGLVAMTLLSRLAPTDAEVARVFLPMAALYSVFAFPTMFISPDFPARAGWARNLCAPYRRLRRTFRDAKRHRPLFRFLIGNFLYKNATASVITVMGLYSRNVMGFQASELETLFGPAIIVAALSAWGLFGPLIGAIGPKRTLLVVLAIWLLLFAATIAVSPDTTLALGAVQIGAKTLFSVIVAPLAGLGLAGVWSASRVMLTALTPVEQSGEFWGLSNLSGRTASVFGDATWSLILSLLGEGIFGYHVAVAALAVYVLLGAGFVLSLPDVRPAAENFLQQPG
jgi:UMF1 family MFS transporter